MSRLVVIKLPIEGILSELKFNERRKAYNDNVSKRRQFRDSVASHVPKTDDAHVVCVSLDAESGVGSAWFELDYDAVSNEGANTRMLRDRARIVLAHMLGMVAHVGEGAANVDLSTIKITNFPGPATPTSKRPAFTQTTLPSGVNQENKKRVVEEFAALIHGYGYTSAEPAVEDTTDTTDTTLPFIRIKFKPTNDRVSVDSYKQILDYRGKIFPSFRAYVRSNFSYLTDSQLRVLLNRLRERDRTNPGYEPPSEPPAPPAPPPAPPAQPPAPPARARVEESDDSTDDEEGGSRGANNDPFANLQ